MTVRRTFVKSALIGAITLGVSAVAPAAMAAKEGFEKCEGIAAKGMNDCGTSKHGCAGQAVEDNSAEEWVYLPEGTCKKIAGGKVKGKS